jgi:hypothetical protein
MEECRRLQRRPEAREAQNVKSNGASLIAHRACRLLRFCGASFMNPEGRKDENEKKVMERLHQYVSKAGTAERSRER